MNNQKSKNLTSKESSDIISIKEQNLLEKLHKIGFGRVTLYIEDGQPIRIEEGIKSTKL